MSYCTNCGTLLSDGTTVCPKCGSAVTPPVEDPGYQDPNGYNGYQSPSGYNGYQSPNGYNGYQSPNGYNGYQNPNGYQDPNAYRQPYGGPGYNGYPGPDPQPFNRMGGYRANIRKREIALPIILIFLTCGIYGLVWFFHLVSDLNTAGPEPDDKTPGTVLLLSIVTCGIYGLIWVYGAGSKVDRLRQFNGESSSSCSMLYLLLSLFGLGIVTYCLIQSELNKVAMDA